MDSRLVKLEKALGEATPTVIVVAYTGDDGEELAPSEEEVEAARKRAIEEGRAHIVVYPAGNLN